MDTVHDIGFLLFPDMLQLDFTGAYGVFAQVPGVTIHLLSESMEPVRSGDGLVFQPTVTLAACPKLDILVVPGGSGVVGMMSNAVVLDFLRQASTTCRYSVSVCTGSLILGAAGLLRGRRATTHWQSLDLLSLLGATPVRERVVYDGSVVTAAGVTSGIDLALSLVGKVWGDERAQAIQLGMEYSPQPPYASGSPDTAPEPIMKSLVAAGSERQAVREAAARKAAAVLGL